MFWSQGDPFMVRGNSSGAKRNPLGAAEIPNGFFFSFKFLSLNILRKRNGGVTPTPCLSAINPAGKLTSALHRFLADDLCTNFSPISVKLCHQYVKMWNHYSEQSPQHFYRENWKTKPNGNISSSSISYEYLFWIIKDLVKLLQTLDFSSNSAISQFNSVCNKCSLTSKAEKVQLPNLRSHFWSSKGNQVISGPRDFSIQGNVERGLYLWCKLTWKVRGEHKDNSRRH